VEDNNKKDRMTESNVCFFNLYPLLKSFNQMTLLELKIFLYFSGSHF
jgi:hypothetical protein